MVTNEVHGITGDGVREVRDLGFDLRRPVAATYVFVPAIASGERLVSKVGTAPGAKAVELIEAAICRVERRSQAEMPLSDQSGNVSRRTHSVGDGAFGEWKPAFDPTGIAGKVVLVSASLMVAAG